MKLNNRGSWGLIALLVAVAIVFIVVALIYGRMGPEGPSTVSKDSKLLDPQSQKQTLVGKAIDTGKAHVCLNQLSQIRQGIQMYKTTDGSEQNPPTLKDIGLAVGMEFYQCPVSGKPYVYDPATGTVQCQTHVKY